MLRMRLSSKLAMLKKVEKKSSLMGGTRFQTKTEMYLKRIFSFKVNKVILEVLALAMKKNKWTSSWFKGPMQSRAKMVSRGNIEMIAHMLQAPEINWFKMVRFFGSPPYFS